MVEETFAEDIKLAITCPICLSACCAPRILPECAHTYCEACIYRTAKFSPAGFMDHPKEQTYFLRCPECRSPNFFAKGTLKANVLVERVADQVKALGNKHSSVKTENVDPSEQCPHVASNPKLANECSHCKTSFCQICFYRHMEDLKAEIICSALKFQSEYESCNAAANQKIQKVITLIDITAAKIERDIKTSHKALEDRLVAQIRSSQDRLTALTRKSAAGRKRQFEEISGIQEDGGRQLAKAADVSVLAAPVARIIELNKKAESYISMVKRMKRLNDNELPQDVFDIKYGFEESFDDHLVKLLKVAENNAIAVEPLNMAADDAACSEQESVCAKIHNAAVSGDLEALKSILLVDGLPSAVRLYLAGHTNSHNNYATPLIEACCYDNIEVVKFLVEKMDADIKAVDSKGLLAIHHAAASGSLRVVEYLVSINPSIVELQTKDGKLPRELVAENDTEISKLLKTE